MTGNLSFWAQALDNESPDHIQHCGKELAADDTVKRQEVTSLVSQVVRQGMRIFDSAHVQLTADPRCFVLEIPSTERDQAGRIAPIVCHGKYEASAGEELGPEVVASMQIFASQIGRTLPREYSQLVLAAFDTLKKKSGKARRMRAAAVLVPVLAILILLLIYSTGSKQG